MGPSGAVAIVGGGSWGTALAVHLGRTGREVRLWFRDPSQAVAVSTTRGNERYLSGVTLPPGVTITADSAEALQGADIVVVAVPSHSFAAVARRVSADVSDEAVVISATKGLDPERRLRMSQLIDEILPGRPLAVLSGPSFAREVARGLPTALVVAAREARVARLAQRRLATHEFRLYTNRDVVGVEMAGALKNVIAIAAGLSDSLGLGDNARAALITRGLAEMTRIGVAFGAAAATFAGLAGVGDLVLTCTGALSRNRALGLAVGAGMTPAEVQAGTPMVVEGVHTVSAALHLARQAAVSTPICEAVTAVLHGGVPASDALTSLLNRELRPEEEGALLHA
jgi:glycerol-3-phosphate dehydrogenase (NAD(P)+)